MKFKLVTAGLWLAAAACVQAQTLTPGRYTLQAAHSGKCLDVAGVSTADNAAIQQATCTSVVNQQFTVQALANDRYALVNVNSGKCLDVQYASKADSAPLLQYACNGAALNQQFTAQVASGRTRFTNVNSGKCLDIQGASAAEGARLLQYTCSATATNQQFILTAVAAPPTGTVPAPPQSPAPVVNYEYDAQGNPTRTIQAPNVSGLDLKTVNTYDALNRVKDSTDAKAGVTKFGYDGLDRTTKVTDPRNLVTQYPRNGLGDATQLISPDTGTAAHTYDADGNLKTRLDSRGVLATYSYDAENRLTGVVYSKAGSTSLTQTWTYDLTGTDYGAGKGRLSRIDHPNGATRYVYSAFGEVTTDVQRINAATGANSANVVLSTSYTFDAVGHLTGITYPSGRKVTIGYTSGQVTSLGLAKDAGSAATPLISAIQWEPFGGVKGWQWNLSTGLKAHNRTYDTSGRIVRYPLGGVYRDIRYDEAGRIKSYTHLLSTNGDAQAHLDQSFGYDALGRITGVAMTGANWTIGYDANGNRTGVTLNGAASTYTTPATSNKLASITNPARTFGYDAAGNTTQDTGKGFTATYDLAGRLETLTKAGVTTRYTYDGLGRRIRKVSSTGVASTVLFAYGQDGQLLGEYDSNGKALREYVWLGSTPIAIFTSDPANAANPPLAYYVHADHLDTPRIVVDRNGTGRWTWLAEPFGTTAPDTNPKGLGVFTQNLRFPGQYADQESGLFYNYFRDYDASTGRYAESDPIGLGGGINTYAYVNGNALLYFDPNGLWAWGDSLPQGMVDFSAGWGDILSFGITAGIRRGFDFDAVNRCSTYYRSGEVFGFANGLALGWAQGTKAAAKAASPNKWANFSHSMVPHSAMKGSSNPIVRWMDKVGNRINGDYIPAGPRPDLHDLMDPVAARIGGRYPTWPAWRRLINRMPYVPGSALYGAASALINECECDK